MVHSLYHSDGETLTCPSRNSKGKRAQQTKIQKNIPLKLCESHILIKIVSSEQSAVQSDSNQIISSSATPNLREGGSVSPKIIFIKNELLNWKVFNNEDPSHPMKRGKMNGKTWKW